MNEKPSAAVPFIFQEVPVVHALGQDGLPLNQIKPDTIGELGLVSYDDAFAFMLENPPHTPRRVTSTWTFLAKHAFDRSVTAEIISPERVKTYLFTPDFIIAKAAHTSNWLRRSSTNCFYGYTRVSAPLLIDIANKMLGAEPQIPEL